MFIAEWLEQIKKGGRNMKRAISIAMVSFLLSVPSFAATLQPQRGGTLRILTNVVPTNFGNPKLVAGGKAPYFPAWNNS